MDAGPATPHAQGVSAVTCRYVSVQRMVPICVGMRVRCMLALLERAVLRGVCVQAVASESSLYLVSPRVAACFHMVRN